MTKFVQIAPGVVFSADVLHPTWGQSIVPGKQATSRGIHNQRGYEAHGIDVTASEDMRSSDQIELL
ncbi:hypothetical protein SAMN05192544_1025116 [Paraburkholderia hospita]|nr:hypothetical protein SAMN05192544_1025116 [Paraburkholderia hospita]